MTTDRDNSPEQMHPHAGMPPSAPVPGAYGSPAGRPQAGQGSAKRTVVIVLVALIAAVAIIVALVLAFCGKGDFYDSNSLIGQAPYKSQEEVQAELDRIVEEGMLNISIASVIEFADGTSPGTAYIENVPGNHYVMQVDIVLDETGETIYRSGGLKPDSYIEKIALSQDLDAGSYAATATFHALDPDTLDEVGQAAAKVTLNVLG